MVAGIDKIGKHLEIPSLLDSILDSGDRRLARQRRAAEVARGRINWNLGSEKMYWDTKSSWTPASYDVKWDRSNAIFADVFTASRRGPSGCRG